MDKYYLNHEDFNYRFNITLRAQYVSELHKGKSIFCCLFHARINCIEEYKANKNCSSNPFVMSNTKMEVDEYQNKSLTVGCLGFETFNKTGTCKATMILRKCNCLAFVMFALILVSIIY